MVMVMIWFNLELIEMLMHLLSADAFTVLPHC